MRRLFPLTLLFSVLACQDGASPAAPTPLPPLEAQTWYVHVSDGQALPALLGHRLVGGGVLEQDFLDSTRFTIQANGTWEMAGWFQRFHNGAWSESGTSLDWGTWTVATSGYEFRRHTGELLYSLPSAPENALQLNLRYQGQAGVAVSTLRRDPAPVTVVSRWRAISLSGHTLPASYLVDSVVDVGAGPVSRHIFIDSSTVWLDANGRYRQRVHYSEWEGPAFGEPTQRLYAAAESDFGSWTLGGAAILLESGWLQNKRITGDVSGQAAGSIRLDHGITHGDEPAPLMYQRQ